MQSGSLRSLLLVGGAASALLALSPARAQDPAPASAEPSAAVEATAEAEEEVVVTGIRAKSRNRARTVVTTPVPVDIINAQAIESSGALGGEVGQALQNLVPSFNFPRQSNSGSADIVRPAQLRGLSPDQVLVLINGKRRHTTGVITTEAKTGRGTAPVDFNSIPTNAIKRIEVLRDGAGAQYGSDAIAGVINVILDDTPEGIEVDASYGLHVTDFEPSNEHIEDGATWVLQAKMGIPLDERGGFIRFGAEYKDREPTNRAGLDQVPFFEDAANIPLVGGQRNFKPGDGASENLNLWFNAEAPLEGGLELYGFGTFNDRSAEGTGFFRYPVSSANLIAINPLGYRPITTGDNQDIGLTAGLRSTEGALVWDVSANYGRNRFEGGVYNTLNPSLGPTSPRSFFTGAFENELIALNADASQDIEIGLETPATLAFGVEYRHDSFQSFAGDPLSYQAGPLAATQAIGAQAGSGLRPEETRDLSRDTFAIYAELSADLSENFFVDVAARFENSSDFGSTLAGKAALRWQATDAIALRASVSNSYRAPSLVQIGFATSSTSFGAGGQLTSVATLPVDDPLAIALGAQPLDAESAINFSAGFTVDLPGEFVLTVDAYNIQVDDRITLSERIDRDSAPVGVQPLFDARNITAANFFTNAIDTETNGIDIVGTYSFQDILDGELNLSAGFSYARTRIRAVRNLGPVTVIGVEESNTIEDAAPKSKLILTADWTDKEFSALLRVTRYGEATRVFNFGGGFEPEQTYGEEWQVDLEGSWRINGNVEIYAGASNLFDTYPDLSSADINYFGNLPYDVLSPIGMNGRYLYTGIRTKF
jgi:iron complex outermembrane receptor protein